MKSFTGGSRRPSCSTSVAWPRSRRAPCRRCRASGRCSAASRRCLPRVVERQREAHVHQMRAAEIGVVDDVDVAGLRRRRRCPRRSAAISSAVEYCMVPTKTGRPELALADQRAGRPCRRCRTERSSASAMTGEKAERVKAMSISLQTCCRPAWITASVMASSGAHGVVPRRPSMRRLPIGIDGARAAPGSMHRRRVELLTIAGPVDARVERQLFAIEDLRCRASAPSHQTAAASRRSRRLVERRCARPAGIDQRGDRIDAGRRPITEVTRLTRRRGSPAARTWKRAK